MSSRLLASALCLALPASLAAQGVASSAKVVYVSLPKGTQVNLVMLERVSSGSAKKGQEVRMAVAEDLTASGYVLIPKGTPVTGVVWRQRTPEPGKRNGYVWVRPVSLTLLDGTQLKLLEDPPGWNPCGGMGTWCTGYIVMAPYTIAGLVSLLFEAHHHPDQPGEDLFVKACLPLPGYIAADYSFRTARSDEIESAPSIASNIPRIAACHVEFPAIPYNYGYVLPPTVWVR